MGVDAEKRSTVGTARFQNYYHGKRIMTTGPYYFELGDCFVIHGTTFKSKFEYDEDGPIGPVPDTTQPALIVRGQNPLASWWDFFCAPPALFFTWNEQFIKDIVLDAFETTNKNMWFEIRQFLIHF